MAAIRYVIAAHFNASCAFGNSVGAVTLERCNQAKALFDASNSTGKVMIEKMVVKANRMIPARRICGKALIRTMPAMIIH